MPSSYFLSASLQITSVSLNEAVHTSDTRASAAASQGMSSLVAQLWWPVGLAFGGATGL